MTGKPELSVHKAVGNSSYGIKLSSLVVSTDKPYKRFVGNKVGEILSLS